MSYDEMRAVRREILRLVAGHTAQDAVAALTSAAVIVGRSVGMTDDAVADVLVLYTTRIPPGQEVP